MRLPFFWLSLGFASGIVLEKYQAISVTTCLCLGSIGFLFLWFLRGRRLFLPFFILLMTLAGFFCSRQDSYKRKDAVEHFAGPYRTALTGVVTSLPNIKTRGKRVTASFIFTSQSVMKWEKGKRKEVKTTGKVQAILIQPSFLPRVGDVLEISGNLEKPRQAFNPGEFDYERYLAGKNIYAMIQVIGGWHVRRLDSGKSPWWSRWLADSRQRIAELIDKLYPSDEAAILKPLVIGVWADVRSEIRNQFMKTGTIHLLAISGLNITMIAGSFYLVFLLLGQPYKFAAVLTSFVVLVYMGLAGFGLPVQRAGLMAILAFLGIIFGRRTHFLNILCFAFFSLLLARPRSLWDVGFQLSFLSIFSLVLILPAINHFNMKTLSLSASAAVLVGTFPLILFYFNIFSPISIFANLIGIPVFDAALFSSLFALLFCKVPVVGTLWGHISSFFLWLGLVWVKGLSTWKWGYWFFVKPSLSQMVLYYSALAGFLCARRWRVPWRSWLQIGFALFWLTMTVSFFLPKEGQNVFCLTVLASGRNQIAHIRFANKTNWLVNAGRNFPSDQGEWLIGPYLRSQGIQALEGVLLADPAKNHAGGLPAILRDFSIYRLLCLKSFFSSLEPIRKILARFHGEIKNLRVGDKILIGDEELRVIAQGRSGVAVEILSKPWNILLFSKWDHALLSQMTAQKDSEIHALVLPPAGKITPKGFYDWVSQKRPLLVILQASNPDLEKYFRAQQIPCLNLERTGAVTFKKNGELLELESFLLGKLGFFSYQ